MNVSTLAKNAYSSHAAPARTERGAEYDAFVFATRKLHASSQSAGKVTRQLAEAVDLNRRLWTLLATDAASDGNQLSEITRAGIISLYEFTCTHSRKVLRGEERVETLIEINAAIMRGLNGGGVK